MQIVLLHIHAYDGGEHAVTVDGTCAGDHRAAAVSIGIDAGEEELAAVAGGLVPVGVVEVKVGFTLFHGRAKQIHIAVRQQDAALRGNIELRDIGVLAVHDGLKQCLDVSEQADFVAQSVCRDAVVYEIALQGELPAHARSRRSDRMRLIKIGVRIHVLDAHGQHGDPVGVGIEDLVCQIGLILDRFAKADLHPFDERGAARIADAKHHSNCSSAHEHNRRYHDRKHDLIHLCSDRTSFFVHSGLLKIERYTIDSFYHILPAFSTATIWF